MSETNEYLYIFRGGADPAAMTPEQMQQNMGAWMNWIGGLRASGQFKAGSPLQDDTKTLSGPGGASVTDGPYAEAKETVGGYLIVAAKDMAEAAALAKGCPIFAGGGTVEVRPVQKMEGM
jgi:hypothetical protein